MTEPYKLVLVLLTEVKVLSFTTEDAANEAEDFFKNLGWHTLVLNDQYAEEPADE